MTTWAEAAGTARTRAAAALATASPGIRVAHDNAPPLSPPPGAAETWARVSFLEVGPGRYSFGSPRVFEDLSLLAIELFAPLGQGDGGLRAIADALRSALPPATVSGVSFSLPRFVPLGLEDAWIRGRVLIDVSSEYSLA